MSLKKNLAWLRKDITKSIITLKMFKKNFSLLRENKARNEATLEGIAARKKIYFIQLTQN